MTPKEKADELTIQYENNALVVCETLFAALKWDYVNDKSQQCSEDKINFWWDVLLELGYDC